MNRIGIAVLALAVIVVVVLGSALYTVDQTQQALITQFGEPVRVVETPGLHVKLPFMQTVIPIDRRLLAFEIPGEEVILVDQRRLDVDSFAMLRITNPLRYYQAVGPAEDAIRPRLVSTVQSSLRRVLGGRGLLAVLSSQREEIMRAIRDQVNSEMHAFGVDIVDVRIRRADLPEENKEAILARMKSERVRIANQARAEGAAAAAQIRADADRERTVLLANARAEADRLRGEGEEQASRMYAGAYGQDPGFFAAWRTMQAYRTVFDTGNTRLVLTPDNDFLHILQAPPMPGN
jgi:membrane protease subunit HflC